MEFVVAVVVVVVVVFAVAVVFFLLPSGRIRFMIKVVHKNAYKF